MAFTGNFSCNTLRSGLASGSFDFSTDVFRLALYTNAATLDQTTTAYTATGEATGGNYAATGLVVTATVGTESTSSGSIVFINFSSPAWTGVITARGALIYKAGANGAVCVLDFGNDKTSTNTFTVTMPANTSTSALIRLA
jgi:hypothetical protein